MPVYEYRCEECGKMFEMVASFADYDEGLDAVCPKCASKMAQRIIGKPMVMTASKSHSEDFEDTGGDYGSGADDMSGMDDYMDDMG